MNSTVGHLFVWAALACAGFGAVLGFVSGVARRQELYPWVRRAAFGFFACMLLANLTMVYALVKHDFSVKYVAQVGSRATPLVFTIVSLWSALEGSILFWGAILGVYVLAFAIATRRENPRAITLALATTMFVGAFFAFLISGPADPFVYLSPAPTDGPGPNALLQNHILMVIHPPMLYLGYVGMTIPFGVAISALLRGDVGEAWLAPFRRWTLIPWTFLSVGILLGSWWAYAVLGWGGYWAWDPVENASFLPWLTATAFLHSLMVLERKKSLKLWTIILGIATFWLTIVGTFMTRSGIFNSVHSFTQSDIGPTILVFIAVVLVGSVALLLSRGHLLLADAASPQFPLASRETAILINNLLFTAITFTVFLGSTFPLVSEALRGARVSVGEPYFNKMAVPGGVLLLFLMGVGPSLPWGRADSQSLRSQLLIPGFLGLLVVAICFAFGLRGLAPLTAYGFAGFAAAVTVRQLSLPALTRMKERGEPFWTALAQSAIKAPRRFGGYVIHLGIVVIFVAIAASSTSVTHATATLSAGKDLAIGKYRLRYLGIENGKEPHRSWTAAKLELTSPSGAVDVLTPRMNFYERSTDPIGTPAVKSRFTEDFYVSLLAFSDGGRSASFNAWIFPLVGWIWWTIPILVLGSLITLWPSRRKALAVSVLTSPQASPNASRSPAA